MSQLPSGPRCPRFVAGHPRFARGAARDARAQESVAAGARPRLHSPKEDPPRGEPFADGQLVRYIRSIIALPKPEHDTCFAPCMSRAKS